MWAHVCTDEHGSSCSFLDAVHLSSGSLWDLGLASQVMLAGQ